MGPLDALYAQLGFPQNRPYVPYDQSAEADIGGYGFPGDLGAAPLPVSATGIINQSAPPAAPEMFGYAPQPRPPLPPQLTRGGDAASTFGPYNDTYAPPPEEQDPLAALLSGMGLPSPGAAMPAQPAPSRALTPTWMGPAQAQPQYGAGQAQIDRQAQTMGPTESEKALLRQSPAYGRAIRRIRELDAERARRGM